MNKNENQEQAQPSPAVDLSGLTRYAPGGFWRAGDGERPVMDRTENGDFYRVEDVWAALSSAPVVGEGKMTDEQLEQVYQQGFDNFAGPKQFRHASNYPDYHRAGLKAVREAVEREVLATGKGDAESSDSAPSDWLIGDPPAVVERLRKATQDLLGAACEHIAHNDKDSRLSKAATEADNALADCVGDWPVAQNADGDLLATLTLLATATAAAPTITPAQRLALERAMALIFAKPAAAKVTTPSTPSQAWNGELPEPDVDGTLMHPELKICYTGKANYSPKAVRKAIGAAVAGVRDELDKAKAFLVEHITLIAQLRGELRTAQEGGSKEFPEGWKPMPPEPTETMLKADPYGMGYGRLQAIYSALFKAAPDANGGQQ